MREGGYGDILWIARMAKLLKEQYGQFRLWIATRDRHHMIFDENKFVDKVLPYPLAYSEYKKADIVVCFKGLIEEDRSGMSVYDLYAGRLGLIIRDDEKVPLYVPRKRKIDEAKKWMHKKVKNKRFRNVMLHLAASSPWKSWPLKDNIRLAATLGMNGFNVFMVGSMFNWPFSLLSGIPNGYQLCAKPGHGNQRENYWQMDRTVALLSQMDLFIGPDSGLGHFAAALDIPSISIYGPFPAKAYVSNYPKCTAIEPMHGRCSKMPCFPHLNNVCPIRDRLDNSPCLKSITIERILAVIDSKIGLPAGTKPVTITYGNRRGL
jgi:ADP-heptose:LPS heptosyltransferase